MPEADLLVAAEVNPPQPLSSLDSAPYWESLKQGVFALQHCPSCDAWQFPPAENCRVCASDVELRPISGRGTIHTFIVEHRGSAPGFAKDLPYVIVLVTPDEAPHVRIPARIVDADIEDVAIGKQVQSEIVALRGGDYKIPVFRLL